MLCANNTLQELNLEGIYLIRHRSICLTSQGNNIGDLGADEIAKAMRVNRCLASKPINPFASLNSISELNLSRNMICDNGFSYLSSALSKSPNVTQLDLSHNNGRPRGMRIFFENLKVCSLLNPLKMFSFAPGKHSLERA